MAMEPQPSSEIKAATGWVIFLSIGLIGLGAVAILTPGVALAFFTAGLGWLVLVGGILQIIQAFQAGLVGGKWLGLGVGAFYAVAGLYIVINPVKSAAVFAFALGLLFIAEGIFTIIMAFGYKVGRTMSWLVAINGIVTLILGILVINGWPMRSLWLIGLYVGVSLLLSGSSLLGAALAVRKEMAE